jgi:uncharacterized protein (TIGR02391 family)
MQVPRRAAVRRITAPVRARIGVLVEVLQSFLPLTSRSASTVTFRSIFAESQVASYLDGPENKRQALQQGFTELYRRHERLPYAVVRKIVPAAIEYRRHKRHPLRRAEVDALSTALAALGIDMASELAEIEIDESLPRVTVPPEELKRRLRAHDLDPAIASEPLDLFVAGHFNEAVRKAAERYEDRVRDLAGLDAYGRDLMARAFATADHLDLATYAPENRQDFQEGYKLLAMGSMAAVRNVFSHGDEERRSPEECFEMLLLLNWLLRPLK